MKRLMIFLAFLVAVATAADDPRIKNVVVVMMENRAFDHMVGYLQQLNPEIDGLSDFSRYNLVNVSDPKSAKIFVDDQDTYVDWDPDHGIGGTFEQIFGNKATIVLPPPMNGFAQQAIEVGGTPHTVMSCFNHSAVPIISTLAMEFAIFDRYFASVPGPTFPNRLYFLSATSHGFGDNSVLQSALGWPQKSWFQLLSETTNKSFNIYAEEVATALLLRDMRADSMLKRFKNFAEFLDDAKNGQLPDFSMVEPVYFPIEGIAASDQHPSHSVLAGEQFLKDVYEAVRASPQWNETLLLITYDEHGGFSDHVPTPTVGIPNPDGLNASEPFSFDRLGIRVPCIMVSPWIKKGLVVHDGIGPTPTSHYDHTSMIATMRKIWGIQTPLTKRDAWASTFEKVWSDPSVKTPRTDCPMTLPPLPSMHPSDMLAELEQPVNDLQEQLLTMVDALNGVDYVKGRFNSQREAGVYARETLEKLKNKN